MTPVKFTSLAVASECHHAILPELPSAHEQGLSDLNVTTWAALAAPKSTPPEIVAKLNDAIGKTLDTPAVQELLTKYGMAGVAPARRSPAYLNVHPGGNRALGRTDQGGRDTAG